ncbi:hypothetical protein GCM10027418_03690 [Mariniluteicoccus endophyticus]
MVKSRVRLAAASALLLLGAGCTSEPSPTPPPAPVDTPPNPPNSAIPTPDAPTAPPADGVTPASLPTAGDLVGRVQGPWKETVTTDRSPNQPVSGCQRSQWESFGATSLQVREYAGPGGSTAAAVAMGFPSAEDAQRASDTVAQWWSDCSDVVTSQGGSGVEVVEKPAELTVDGGRGSVDSGRWTLAGKQVSEGHATVLLGTRLGVVVMKDSQPVPRDVLTRSLENAARRLRG